MTQASITLLSLFPSDFATFGIDKPLKSSSPPLMAVSKMDWENKHNWDNTNIITKNNLRFINFIEYQTV